MCNHAMMERPRQQPSLKAMFLMFRAQCPACFRCFPAAKLYFNTWIINGFLHLLMAFESGVLERRYI